MSKSLPPVVYLRQLFRVGGPTGLVWRKRPVSHFAGKSFAAAWNTKFAGKPAGCHKGRGYYTVRIDGSGYHVHRVVFVIHTGRDPGPLHVDHKNGDASDNRPSNLQLATNSENLRKRVRPPKSNTSGVLGVGFHKAARKWSASISYKGRKHHLGLFAKKRDAASARRVAETKLFGTFAPL